MTRNKPETRRKILISAKKEFLKHGFEKTSVRQIAKGAGITAGALYKHFLTKEDIFTALVDPVYIKMHNRSIELTENTLNEIQKNGLSFFKEKSDRANRELLDFIFNNFDEFQLMFNCANGTKYEDIRHQFVTFDMEGGKKLISVLKKKGLEIEDFSDDQLHLLYSTGLTPLFEIITHGYSYEKSLTFIDIIEDAVNFGWRKIIKENNFRNRG